MQYAGEVAARELDTLLSTGLSSYDDVERALDLTETALDEGLPCEASKTRAYAYLDGVDLLMADLRLGQIPPEWAASHYERLRTGAVGQWTRMLPPDEQIHGWRFLDLLHSRLLLDLSETEALGRGNRFIAEHPVAAPQTAAVLLAVAPSLFESPQSARRAAELIDIVNQYADSPTELLIAAQAEFDENVHFARRLEEAEPNHRRQLVDLLAYHEGLTETYGDFSVQKKFVLNFEGRKHDSERRHRHELQLIELTQGWSAGPYSKVFKDYLMGRICAVTSDWRKAAKLYNKCLDRGFCERVVVYQLAFLYLQQKKNNEARDLIERYADRWLVEQDSSETHSFSSGETLGSLYEGAGGDRSELGVAKAQLRFEEQAKQNRARHIASADRLQTATDEAVASFWARCREQAVDAVASLVDASDIDEALATSSSGRTVRIDPRVASRCHLDEVPDFDTMNRAVLLGAVETPLPASAVAQQFVEHLRHLEAAGESFEALTKRYSNNYGASEHTARRRVEATSIEDPKMGAALVDHYIALGSLSAPILVDLELEVLQALALIGERDVADRCERFLDRVDNGEAVRVRFMQACLSLLAEAASAKEVGPLVEALSRRLVDPLEASEALARWWGAWSVKRPAADRAEVSVLLIDRVEDEARTRVATMGVAASLDVVSASPVTAPCKRELDLLRRLSADLAVYGDHFVRWYQSGAVEIPIDAIPAARDTGCWLIGVLDPARGAAVKATMRNLLDRRLAATKGFADRITILSELTDLFPDDDALKAKLDSAGKAQTKRRALTASAIAVAAAVVVLIIQFGGQG